MNDMADLLLIEIEEKMDKAIQSSKREIATIRTGRANPALLDHISIDYYGSKTPLKQIASVTVPEGNQLYIKPFDKSSLKTIETAIQASDLGLNPLNDGVGIRLIIPKLTEERRRDFVKSVAKMGEFGKVAIRNIRRDGNDQMKKLGLTEDAEKGYLEDIQTLTDDHIKRIDEIVAEKEKELMTV